MSKLDIKQLGAEMKQMMIDEQLMTPPKGTDEKGYPCEQSSLDADFNELLDDIVYTELSERLDEVEVFFDNDLIDEELGKKNAEFVRDIDDKTKKTLIFKMKLEGVKINTIARKLNLSVQEVYQYINTASFKNEFNKWQDRVEIELKNLVTKKILKVTPEAVDRQIHIMRTSKNERLVRDIANDFLDRAVPKKKDEPSPLVQLQLIGLNQDKLNNLISAPASQITEIASTPLEEEQPEMLDETKLANLLSEQPNE